MSTRIKVGDRVRVKAKCPERTGQAGIIRSVTYRRIGRNRRTIWAVELADGIRISYYARELEKAEEVIK